MDFFDLIQRRYSVRAYKPDPVEPEKVQKVLEAARLAPTAANRQPFQIIVVQTPGREPDLLRIYNRSWFVEAPLVIGISVTPEKAWVRRYDSKNYADVDAAIAMDHLVLAATELGLGTCWIAAFDPQAARQVLCLPEDTYLVALTPLGYPADQLREKIRKPLSELVHSGQW